MALRDSEKLSAAYTIKTFYDALVALEAAVVGATNIATLLAGDYSSDPPTVTLLNDCKGEYDALRSVAAYEGATSPAVSQVNLWAKVADEAGGGDAVCTDAEKYGAYYELINLIAYLTKVKTDVAADTDVAALMAMDLTSVVPTAANLADARTGWDAIRNGSVYTYGGVSIPSVAVDGRLWNEITAEAAA